MTAATHELPPGKYFIGDPGLVLDDLYHVIIEDTANFTDSTPVEINGQFICGFHIDEFIEDEGSLMIFTDQNDNEYPVGYGAIAAVSIDLVEDPEGEDHGTVIDAPDGLKISIQDGVFRFNDIVINTKEQIDLGGGYDLDPANDKFI